MSLNREAAIFLNQDKRRKGSEKGLEEVVDERDYPSTSLEGRKKCAYKYCSLNDIRDNDVFGFCTATTYRFNRCKNRLKGWLKDLVNQSVYCTI